MCLGGRSCRLEYRSIEYLFFLKLMTFSKVLKVLLCYLLSSSSSFDV